MRYQHIIVDTPNLYHRAFSVVQDDVVEYRKSFIYPKSIKKSLQIIQKLERDYLDINGKITFLFDNHTSQKGRRKEIDPEYKATREQREDSFYKSLNLLHLLLLNYKDTYSCLRVTGHEADDLVPTVLSINPNFRTLLISEDFDWFRSINDKVHTLTHKDSETYINTVESFQKRYGFVPSHESVCMYKSIKGDKSDNIEIGVPSMREIDVVKLVNTFSSFHEMISSPQRLDFLTPTMKKKVIERYPRLLLNYKLIDFSSISEDEYVSNIEHGKFSPNVLKSLYEAIGVGIDKCDPRMLQYFPPKKKSDEVSGFFEFDKIKRV